MPTPARRVFITGANGFLGRSLLTALQHDTFDLLLGSDIQDASAVGSTDYVRLDVRDVGLVDVLLDKRIEVLSYALREAVERMDFNLIHQLAEKAIATRERIAIEQLAASTPGLRERHGDIVIHDDAERGKVVVQFPERVDERTRRVLKIYGFCGSGDGATYWRRRTFRRGENMALDRARDLVERLLDDRAKLAASEEAAFERANPPAVDRAKQRDIEGGWL